MLRKHIILLGIIISIILLVVAMAYYPGGSQFDKNSIGFDWTKNYLSNLFTPQAVNGQDNPNRLWAIGGMFFLCTSFALFFYRCSKKMPERNAVLVVKYVGIGAVLFGFLAVTPLHDLAVAVGGTGELLSIFYITVFTFKSKQHFMKMLSVLCLLFIYCCTFIYYTRIYLEFLPVMQKVTLFTTIVWVLCLEYFTTAADFQYKRRELQ